MILHFWPEENKHWERKGEEVQSLGVFLSSKYMVALYSGSSLFNLSKSFLPSDENDIAFMQWIFDAELLKKIKKRIVCYASGEKPLHRRSDLSK